MANKGVSKMIYIATHKKVKLPEIEDYVILQVGADGKEDYGYVCDNTGDSISDKNSYYCELTGLYWIWKNCHEKYKGLVHYRRFFGRSNISSDIRRIYTYNQMVGFLRDADVVLPYIEYFKENARDELTRECCTSEIFDHLEQIVEEKYPQYIRCFTEYFCNNRSTLFNMMFCESHLFDSYCEWLFDILFELEKRIDLSVPRDNQKRLYGYLSERLLNVWVMKNKLRVKNVPVIQTELSMKELLSLVRRRITNRIRFRFKMSLNAE